MTLSNNRRMTRIGLVGLTAPVGLFDGNAELVKAVPLILDGQGETGGLAYSDTAEDNNNATPGDLDLQPGLVYTGVDGGYVNVEVYNLDAVAALSSPTGPTSSDSVGAALFINSKVAAGFDEGMVSEMDTATPEFNINQQIGPLVSGDVVRVGLIWSGETDADLTLPNPGEVRIT